MNHKSLVIMFLPAVLAAQTCPLHKQPMADLDHRGEQAMGFDQHRTSHHFLLEKSGGVIRVQAIEPSDQTSRTQIQSHLAAITNAFSQGNFTIPAKVHVVEPPGVEEMRALKGSIRYSYTPTGQGGEVEISSQDPRALAAIHKFLRFQIAEHATGNSVVDPR